MRIMLKGQVSNPIVENWWNLQMQLPEISKTNCDMGSRSNTCNVFVQNLFCCEITFNFQQTNQSRQTALYFFHCCFHILCFLCNLLHILFNSTALDHNHFPRAFAVYCYLLQPLFLHPWSFTFILLPFHR